MAITGTLALFHFWETLETRAFLSSSPPGFGFRRGFSFWCPSLSRRMPETRGWITSAKSLPRLVEEFDPKVPIEEAMTPPSSWYTEPSFLSLELDHVFSRGWLAAGFTEQIKNPHDFFTGRYGPWMDTNLVLPLGPTKCQVIFDYFLDASLVDNKKFIEESLKESKQVQIEDIILCEGVQKGLESPAYTRGRYAPSVEKAMHHFHLLLHQSLNKP